VAVTGDGPDVPNLTSNLLEETAAGVGQDRAVGTEHGRWSGKALVWRKDTDVGCRPPAAVPTVVPSVAQTVGAVGCGPNTVKVMAPDGAAPLVSAAEIADASTGTATVPEAGTDTDTDGLAGVGAISRSTALSVSAISRSPRVNRHGLSRSDSGTRGRPAIT
jgi:hypothetical protein